MDKIPKLYTINEVAEILKVSTKTVYRLLERKALSYISITGRTKRISEEMLNEFIQTRSIKGKKYF